MLAEVSKKRVHQVCNETLDNQISVLEDVISGFQNAANDEVKSTAGDKHETAKAHMQWEVEKGNRQLANLIKLKRVLMRIDPSRTCNQASMGALVRTDDNYIYISIGIGKIVVDHEEIMCVSPVAPISRELLGKTEGEELVFNQNRIKILSIH